MKTMWRFIYLGALAPAVIIGTGLWSPFGQATAHGRVSAPLFKVDPFWPKPLPIVHETNPLAATDGYRATGPGSSKSWVTGEVAGHGFDSNDHVFIVTRAPQGNLVSPETVVGTPSPSVIEFDRAGNVVNSWPPNLPTATAPWWTAPIDPIGCDGSPACHSAVRGVPQGIHGLYVDYQDNVWIAGNGDGIVQKYSHDGSTLLLQLGRRGCCDNPCDLTSPVHLACVAAGVPNGGTCTNTAACPASNKSHTLLNEPANVRVDPGPDPVTGQKGSIYVADGYGNHRVVVFDRNGNYLRQWGGVVSPTGSPNPNATAHDRGSFATGDGGHPHCVVLENTGHLYVCDRADDRILVYEKSPTDCTIDENGDRICQPLKIITVIPGTGVTAGRSDGVYKNTLGTAGSAWDLDFSNDRDQSFFFEADGGDEIVWTFDRGLAVAQNKTCTTVECGAWPNYILAGFGVPGHMAGDFTFLHSIGLDSRGNLFTGETINGRRIQKFVPVADLDDARTTSFRPSGYPDVALRHYDPRNPGQGDRDDR
ncbi:MAG TPA: hypothetical protein VFA79_21705 [Myxococcales bacterium]|nr:hypothetical protein [Myxococcales bacterium]